MDYNFVLSNWITTFRKKIRHLFIRRLLWFIETEYSTAIADQFYLRIKLFLIKTKGKLQAIYKSFRYSSANIQKTKGITFHQLCRIKPKRFSCLSLITTTVHWFPCLPWICDYLLNCITDLCFSFPTLSNCVDWIHVIFVVCRQQKSLSFFQPKITSQCLTRIVRYVFFSLRFKCHRVWCWFFCQNKSVYWR